VRIALFTATILVSLSSFAQGPFAAQANQPGTSAIHADSSVFVAWASQIEVQRGKQDIAVQNSDTTTVGNWTYCIGKAEGTVVSLGDSGTATLQFEGLIYNGVGPDFAVFENAFNHTFLELAFVEVSSNGVDFFRFPSHSLTNTIIPVGSFGTVDPTQIHNLAGKYTANYGTPFDLDDLDLIAALDIDAISHIRIVDVVGSLSSNHSQRDSQGRKINDQYPTPFPSGGFDLDAVGIIYMKGVGELERSNRPMISIYPNPSNGIFHVNSEVNEPLYFELRDITGRLLETGKLASQTADFSNLKKGTYMINLIGREVLDTRKIIIQ
jgi:hypothetical protein